MTREECLAELKAQIDAALVFNPAHGTQIDHANFRNALMMIAEEGFNKGCEWVINEAGQKVQASLTASGITKEEAQCYWDNMFKRKEH